MSGLSKEQFEQLPDFLSGSYEEKDGEFFHIGELKTVALKGSLNELNNKYKTEMGEVKTELEQFKTSQAEAIESARKQALEEARTKGDVTAIEKDYQERMADLERRTRESVANEKEQEFKMRLAESNAKTDLNDVVMSLNPHSDAADALKLIVSQRQKIDETGKLVYLNADGSASSLDKKGLIAELKELPAIKRLIKPDHIVNGGGNAKGSNGGSAPSKTATRDEFERMTSDKKMAFAKSGGKVI